MKSKGSERFFQVVFSFGFPLFVINPSPAPTHYALGLVYEKRADYEKSALQFKEGIKTFTSGKK